MDPFLSSPSTPSLPSLTRTSSKLWFPFTASCSLSSSATRESILLSTSIFWSRLCLSASGSRRSTVCSASVGRPTSACFVPSRRTLLLVVRRTRRHAPSLAPSLSSVWIYTHCSFFLTSKDASKAHIISSSACRSFAAGSTVVCGSCVTPSSRRDPSSDPQQVRAPYIHHRVVVTIVRSDASVARGTSRSARFTLWFSDLFDVGPFPSSTWTRRCGRRAHALDPSVDSFHRLFPSMDVP